LRALVYWVITKSSDCLKMSISHKDAYQST
jgi:hypothetical protein